MPFHKSQAIGRCGREADAFRDLRDDYPHSGMVICANEEGRPGSGQAVGPRAEEGEQAPEYRGRAPG